MEKNENSFGCYRIIIINYPTNPITNKIQILSTKILLNNIIGYKFFTVDFLVCIKWYIYKSRKMEYYDWITNVYA
jgi:hypothetical protein